MRVRDIKRVRKAAALTIREMAEALECSPATVFRWEHGQCEPQPKHVRALRALAKKHNLNLAA